MGHTHTSTLSTSFPLSFSIRGLLFRVDEKRRYITSKWGRKKKLLISLWPHFRWLCEFSWSFYSYLLDSFCFLYLVSCDCENAFSNEQKNVLFILSIVARVSSSSLKYEMFSSSSSSREWDKNEPCYIRARRSSTTREYERNEMEWYARWKELLTSVIRQCLLVSFERRIM